MNTYNIKSALQSALESEIDPAQIRLWPPVQQRLVTGKRSSFQPGATSMKTDFPRTLILRRATLILVAVIVGLAILLATPQGRAFAQSLLHFFTRTPGDTIPAPTSAPMKLVNPAASTPSPMPSPTGFAFSDDCGNLPVLKCSVEQIRAKVRFTVKELRTIPKGLYFVGATGGPERVVMVYDSPDHSGAVSLVEQPWTGNPGQTAWQVGASAVVETVPVGSVSGEYVKGSYNYTAGDVNEVWDPNLDTLSLQWVEDGVFFQMSATGSKVDKAGLIALAESLTTRPVSARLPPMPTETPDTDTYVKAYADYILTVAEARKQAGFDILEPGMLPEKILFAGATYDKQDKVVSIAYVTDLAARLQGLANGLVLSQQIAPNPDGCKLCGILVGDNTTMDKDRFHMIVSPLSNLKTVQIGAGTGQYVEGHWIGSDCCGWVWTKDDIKTLGWWKDGRAFELSELGTGMTKNDMITIAESIK